MALKLQLPPPTKKLKAQPIHANKDRETMCQHDCGTMLAHQSIQLFVTLSHLSVLLFLVCCLFSHLSEVCICRSTFLSIHPSIYLSICPSIYLSIYAIHLHLFICYVSVYISICLAHNDSQPIHLSKRNALHLTSGQMEHVSIILSSTPLMAPCSVLPSNFAVALLLDFGLPLKVLQQCSCQITKC